MPRPTFPNTGAARRLAACVRRWALTARRPLLPARVRSDRPGPRNLVVVAIDTLRYDRTGLAGGAHASTPALDRLAARGTAFTDVTAPAPWTLSSFASSLTGVMPSLHGAGMAGAVRNLDREPPRRLGGGALTLATHLASAGYRTAAFFSNPFIGFGLVESFQERRYANLPARELAFLALEWIRRHGDGPFFCFVLLNDPHEPTSPPRRALAPRLAALEAGGVGRPSRRQLSALRRWGSERAGTVDLGQLEPPLTAPAERTLAIKLALYDACVAAADEAVGTVERQLEALGLAGSTVLASFADHGEEFLDHLAAGRRWGHDPRGLYGIGHGHTLFQELIHVPWIATGPGVPVGVRVDEPVSLCDVAPTLCDWIGAPPLPLPASGVEGQVGRSVADAPAAASADRIVLSEDIAYGPDLVAVRRGDWKLIATRGGRALALHDLKADPGENEDRLDERPGIAAELAGIAARWAATGYGGGAGPGAGAGPGNWDDVTERVRRQLKELGYSE